MNASLHARIAWIFAGIGLVLIAVTACHRAAQSSAPPHDDGTPAGEPATPTATAHVVTPTPPAALPEAPPPNPPVLATYEAPPAIADKVAGVLRSLLAEGEDSPGRVAALPGGRIVVVAPASIQEGVKLFLDAVQNGPPPPPQATIRIRYWLVLGRPAAAPAGLESLAEAAPALEAVMTATGPMDLRLLDRAELQSIEGDFAKAVGRRSDIEQRAALAENGILADLRIGSRARLETRVLLEPGKLVVLGQVGYDERESAELFGDAPDAPAAAQGATLFHVVQAEVVTPSAR